MENFIRQGIVSDTFPERHTARVTFEDKDDVVSAELPVLVPCASKNKYYRLPDVGESVVCVFEENDSSTGEGFIIGSFFNDKDTPPASDQNVSRVTWEDGSFITFDRSSGKLEINCTGDIVIKGRNIYLN